ncbi:AbrB family transcriptional regulator [Shinella sp. CPCC 100929]|uniref:AbrB family transcriptional regulator n=1 Tax=Shinella lacus TaxID=2654216 RepID=A0ABT1REB9_9HYPH|nr:AbrB family transcriptional regulator [Shinella lacus]MCQ4633541.1 AbrB family transcriptional regulator [Shinella lacus]
MVGSASKTAMWAGFGLAILIGTAGGAVFAYIRFPLPWMLGAMCACTAATLLRLPVRPVAAVRPFMTAIIGVLLGASFSPEQLASLTGWVPTLLGLVGYVLVCAVLVTPYFRLVAGMDLPTAFFSAMPGGVIEMMLVGEEKGGDGRTIALVHSARILFVVAAVPLIIAFLADVTIVTGASATRLSIAETSIMSELLLAGCVVVGMVAGRILKLPARYLLGPMLISAAVHMTGATDFQPAAEVIILAQVVLGTLIGCRFAGVPPKRIGVILLVSAGSVTIMLAIALFFAMGLAVVSPYGLEAILLAYSPGGLNEMSLVALAMDLEVAFVSGHHIVRVILVVALAQLLFRGAIRLAPRKTSDDSDA